MPKTLTLETINDITTRINSTQDLHSLLTVIMDTASEFLNCEGSSLLLYDAESEELIFDIARGARGGLLASKRIPSGQGIAGECAQSRAPIVVNDAAGDDRVLKSFDAEIGFTTRNLLAVPMLARNTLIGVLEVVNTRDGRAYAKSDIRLLAYLSNMAALAIYNRQLYEDLKARMDELDCVYQISQSIRLHTDLDEALESAMQAICEVLDVERVSVIIQDDAGYRLVKTRGFALADRDVRIDPNEGIAGIVMRTGDPMLVRDIEKELQLSRENASRYRTRSFISVPISHEEQVIGVLNAADKKDGQPFDFFELKVLSTISYQMADAFARMLAAQQERRLSEYRKDLETAAMIQMNSLPEIPSQIAGLRIATLYDACRDVGGDFYDLLYHGEERISLVMADVSGKGVPAALFMEYSKTLLAGQIPRYLDPATTLTRTNNEIYRHSKLGMFVTVMLIQVERDMNRLRLASAGHNHQILFRVKTGKIESLSAKGAPLGVFEGTEYIDRVIEYEPGDLLLLYTDGITEAYNESYEEFGEERLFELVRANPAAEPDAIRDEIVRRVGDFTAGVEQADDATMVVVRL